MVTQMVASDNRRMAVRKPAPSGAGLVRCTVRRSKALLGGTTYELSLDDGDLPLLAARKAKSAFLIGSDAEGLKKASEGDCLAQVWRERGGERESVYVCVFVCV